MIDTQSGLTKLDVVKFYASVADLMLPHLKARPVSLVRAPDGTGGELLFPVMLVLGCFTRLSALGLFCLNIVALASYWHVLKDVPVALADHLVWGLMLGEWWESPDGKQIFLTESEAKQKLGDKVVKRVGKLSKSKRNYRNWQRPLHRNWKKRLPR